MKSLALTLLLLALHAEPHYKGPQCLAKFCVDRPTPIRELLPKFVPKGEGEQCIKQRGGEAYLIVNPIHSQPDQVGDVFLSDFPNCFGRTLKTISAALSRWKTAEGVGLGSSEADVLKAYGRPSEKIPISLKGYVRGFIGTKAQRRGVSMGEYRLFYGSANDDLRAAEFGIRRGKVSYIYLNVNE